MRRRGVITVFISLLLSSMLCVVLSVTEMARCYLVSVNTERAMMTALDSVLAEFYGPLFKEYHLMALDTSYQTDIYQGDLINNKLYDTMEYALFPAQNGGTASQRKYTDLLQLGGLDTEIVKRVNLYDSDGEYVTDQAADYMKKQGISNLLEDLLGRFSLLAPNQKTMKVLEEKVAIDNDLSKIDSVTLKLVQAFDGPEVSGTGLVIKNERLKVKEYFIKMFLPEQPVKETVNIQNDFIFSEIYPYYVNYNQEFKLQITRGNLYLENKQKRERCEEELPALVEKDEYLSEIVSELSQQLTYLSEELNAASARIGQMEGEPDPAAFSGLAELSSAVNTISWELDLKHQELLAVRQRLELLHQEINDLTSSLEELMKMMMNAHKVLKTQMNKVDGILDKAEKNIKEAIRIINGTERRIIDYEKLLSSSISEIGQELFESLKEELTVMKQQTGINRNETVKYDRMLVTIKHDKGVLKKVQDILKETDINEEHLPEALVSLQSAWDKMQEYSIQDLNMDYTEVNLKADTAGYEAFQTLLNGLMDGVTSLVLEDPELSEREIDTSTCFSQTYYNLATREETGTFNKSMFSTSNQINLGDCTSSASEYQDELLNKGLEEGLVDRLLYVMYLKEHFVDYTENKESETKDIRVMSYEQEYLLWGKSKDQTNLKLVIQEMILLRFISNLPAAISNTELKQEALVLATAFFGWSGLTFLVKAVQYVIILVCIYLEALIDTSALLMGKEVIAVKSAKQFQTKISDIYKFNYNHIHTTAKGMPDETATGISYSDYIGFLSFFQKEKTKCGRSLDLMELNIIHQYDEKFKIRDCIIGLEMKCEVEFPKRIKLFKALIPTLDVEDGFYRYQQQNFYGY